MSAWEPTLNGYGDPAKLEGLSVSQEFFSVLGVHPYPGRDFLPEEDRPDQNRVVILTYSFWQNRLGGDSSIVGKHIDLSGIPRMVVGILPAARWVTMKPCRSPDRRRASAGVAAEPAFAEVGVSTGECGHDDHPPDRRAFR
jgi:hypothetical protein